jgi:low affinity Fe/Cu permease
MARARSNPLTEAEESVLRHAPHMHIPRLVLSGDAREHGLLDRLADFVSNLVGSMWTFVIVTVAIVVWLFAGNIIGFDKTPWPLLLTVLNLPQLSIMISLQVAANRSQAASDARAIAAYETLVAMHEINKQQMVLLEGQQRILEGQNQVLDIVRGAVTAGGAKG